jgi:prevent-host-death family protein
MTPLHKCYISFMDEVGLREMRQNASDLVKRAQAGERVAITVSGRRAAMLGPIGTRAWRSWDEVAEVFAGPPGDDEWASDLALIDYEPRDPWEHS